MAHCLHRKVCMYVCKLSFREWNTHHGAASGRSEAVQECAAWTTPAEVQGEALARLVRSPTFCRPLHALALAIVDGDHELNDFCSATEDAERRLISAAQALVAIWHEHDEELARAGNGHE